jgi:hypothetical protein
MLDNDKGYACFGQHMGEKSSSASSPPAEAPIPTTGNPETGFFSSAYSTAGGFDFDRPDSSPRFEEMTFADFLLGKARPPCHFIKR